MNRAELIEALEKAEGPGIVLDAEIYCATHDDGERDGRAVILRCSETGHKKTKFAPPAYTSSIDAALTLVPDGWGVINHAWPQFISTQQFYYEVARIGSDPKLPIVGKKRGGAHSLNAIALCIAALKAMEQSDD